MDVKQMGIIPEESAIYNNKNLKGSQETIKDKEEIWMKKRMINRISIIIIPICQWKKEPKIPPMGKEVVIRASQYQELEEKELYALILEDRIVMMTNQYPITKEPLITIRTTPMMLGSIIYNELQQVNQMAQKRRSQTQLADINEQLDDQNKQIKNIQKAVNETQDISTNVQNELYRQKGIINDNIEKTGEINSELNKAQDKTNQMRRRNICIKASLWIVVLVLFAANVALIIWKASK